MLTLLITGFGPFPGVKHNPSEALMTALRERHARFEQWGVRPELHVLPVLYADISSRLARLVAETKPDAILHFGLAGSRRTIRIETSARNRVNPRLLDAAGARFKSCSLSANGPAQIKTRIPATAIVADLRRAGIAAQLSQDAGNYVCNATFFHSLTSQPSLPVGFIHIPWPAEDRLFRLGSRPSFAQIVTAAEIAIMRTALTVRQQKQTWSLPATRVMSEAAMPLGR